MKVVVTSQGDTIGSDTDPRFGRASCFIVVDTDTGDTKVVDNGQNLNSPQGAGIQAAQTVARLKVDAVLTGNCGPKAFRVLTEAGIAIYLGADGTVEKALEKLKAGEYENATGPNVGGHW